MQSQTIMLQRPLEISSLSKLFPTPTGPHLAVQDFRAVIQPGEFVSLLNRALVFQTPSLLPWMTALDNVLLAVAQAQPNMGHREQKAMAWKYLDLVGVAEYADQKPAELSQGTQQRVAIARAFSLEPRFLLLDEPFGALDSITRRELQDLLLDLWEQDRKTVLMVTHDVDEALYLSDRIILMTDGPESRVGLELEITLPRPRSAEGCLDHQDYFRLRREVLQFLEHHSKQF